MDVRFINPFIIAVKKLFSTMLSTDITVGKPFVKNVDEPNADVSSIIGLSGDATGCVVLCFPMETALKAASTFAGVQMTQSHPDFSDALGELANMVAGQAKAQFEGMSVSISLPSVVIGREHMVSQSRQTPRLVLPCTSSLGTFSLEVAMVVDKKVVFTPDRAAAAGVGA